MTNSSSGLTRLLLVLVTVRAVRMGLWVGLSLLVAACGPARKVREPGLEIEFESPARVVLGSNDLPLAFNNPSWRQRILVVQLQLETPTGKELKYRKQIEVPGHGIAQLNLAFEATELGLHQAFLRCYELERGELVDSAVDWGFVVRPLWEFTHDRSYYTDETRLRFRSDLNQALPENTWLEVDLCQDTAVVAKQRIKTKKGRSAGEFDIAPLPLGDYAVKARLMNAGIPLDTVALSLAKRLPAQREVKIDLFTKGLLVDGQPFFPIGLYWLREDLLGQVKKIHFNSGDYFYRLTGAEVDQLMGTAAEVGMGILLELSDLVEVTPEPDYAAIDSLVSVYRDHPALLAWYIVDEPADFPVSPDRVAKIKRRIGQLDPYHPIYLVNNRPHTYGDYAEASDVLAVDVYPVPNYPIGRVREYVQRAQWALGGRKPVWLVAQAFGGVEHWPRPPTPAELRNMVYQGVVSQVRGVMFYRYCSVEERNLQPAELWQEMGILAAELAALSPILLADSEPIRLAAPPGVEASLKYWQGAFYLFLVNCGDSVQQVRLLLPLDLARPEPLYNSKPLHLVGRYLEAELAPLQVGVFRLKPKTT